MYYDSLVQLIYEPNHKTMRISKERTIAELQQDFQASFPGLQLRFYQRQHAEHEGSPKRSQHPASMTLGAMNPALVDGEIELQGENSVANFERELEERFALHAQVFRRSNNLWLQTTSTDDWTLETQNLKGLHSIQANH